MDINEKVLLILVILVLALSVPFESEARIRSRITTDEIPDRQYNVYLYKGYRPGYMLAVFDIPDDDFRVFMYHTMFTKRETGSPDGYVDYFRWRIKGFKTAYELLDKTGKVRGYLMASRFLGYQFLRSDERIGVRVRDYFGGRR
jgi:hypothetical protein